MSRRSSLALSVLVAALPCLAEEDDGLLEADFLTPKEQAERELERRRKAPPVLRCTPARLSATLTKGASKRLTLSVTNAGGQTLGWTIAQSPEWAKPAASGGSLGFEAKQDVVVTVDSSSIEGATALGEIVIEAAGAKGSPLAVPVTVRVLGPPEPEVSKEPEHPVGRVARRQPSAGDDGRPKRLGVRAGYCGYGTPQKLGVGGSALFGLFYGSGLRRKLAYEAGLDLARTEAANDSFTSTLVSGRFDFLFPLGERDARARLYLVSGLACFLETVDDVNTSSANSAAGVDLGVGLGAGRLDVRATYSLLLGSENVAGVTLVSAGVKF